MSTPAPAIYQFKSKLGYNISVDSVDQVPDDDLSDVCDEVAAALRDANRNIATASSLARDHGRPVPAGRWVELKGRRLDLAGLHQLLLARRGRYREEQKRRNQQARQAEQTWLPELPVFFQQVVRNEARPVDYQRWILQAEMRRNAEAVRHRKQGAMA
jgi:hypothetical protein